MRYVDELTDAVRSQLALAYGIKDQLGSALRARLREGYGLADLRADARAGLAVALLALPLSMALARTTGVAPQHGLRRRQAASGPLHRAPGADCPTGSRP